jgi:hypothetical protein
MSKHFRVVAGFGCRSLCVHLNPDSSAANRLGGRSTAGRPNEDSLVDCPRRDCAHCRQRPRDHEQCLQEQPLRMVRSNVRYPTPREDRTQLIAAGACRGAFDGAKLTLLCGLGPIVTRIKTFVVEILLHFAPVRLVVSSF